MEAHAHDRRLPGESDTPRGPVIGRRLSFGSVSKAGARFTAMMRKPDIAARAAEPGEEVAVDIERGRTLFIHYVARSETDQKGECTVFFELNGQPRTVRVADRSAAAAVTELPKAEEGNPGHAGAPMPGMVTKVFFGEGEAVDEGDVLVAIEAMKMETVIRAERGGAVQKVVAPVGTTVDTKDLLVVVGDA